MARPRRQIRRVPIVVKVILIVVALLALVAAGMGVVALLTPKTPLKIVTDRCIATASDQQTIISPTQAHYASIIVGVSVQRGLPVRAATVAIATAYQESRIDNLDYGDRDSLGLFQQRPSQGWGTAEQIMDPLYSTNAFYDALVKVKGWQQMEITKAAQAVQRSGFPDAYAQHEANARAIVAALTGQTQASFTCLSRVATTGDKQALSDFLESIYGSVVKMTTTGQKVSVAVADDQKRWAVAHTLVANYARYGITTVAVGSYTWTPRSDDVGEWVSGDTSVTDTIATVG